MERGMQTIKTCAGIDVSARTLAAVRWREEKVEEKDFSNDAAGHRELLKWLGRAARVCVEATGIYHLQLALTLRAAGVELMVVNPRVAKDFARAMANRSKTDEVDAWTLLEYVRRMDFTAWEAPSAAVLELRELGRRLSELVRAGVDEKNRLHAKNVAAISASVVKDVKAHVAQIEGRIKRIEKAAGEVISEDDDLREEIQVPPRRRAEFRWGAVLVGGDPTIAVKQLVAYAGLDPRVYESGTSVAKPARISKVGNARLRAILFMNALSAIRHDRGARLLFARLVARGKKRMQAIVAVMRKPLPGIRIVLQRRG